ncbi:Dak phosphatase [Opitutaceae bacterium TAV5]|nr:Dak phosphatase [Opitutaceae bacterium TAV5]
MTSATTRPATATGTRDLLIAAFTELVSKKDYLNELDSQLGDGDHGSTIARGGEAAIAALTAKSAPASVNEAFTAAGTAMMTSMGGASGVLFGVFLRAAGLCAPAQTLDAATLAGFIEKGVGELERKTPARVGDKTMMDALIPAAAALRGAAGQPLADALQAAATAARAGSDSTSGMLPRLGRAATLGERARAPRDPGSTSIAILFETLAQKAASLT